MGSLSVMSYAGCVGYWLCLCIRCFVMNVVSWVCVAIGDGLLGFVGSACLQDGFGLFVSRFTLVFRVRMWSEFYRGLWWFAL